MATKDKEHREENLSAFGGRLRMIRKQMGLTQKEFAEKLELSASYLSDIEKGRRGPGFDFFRNLFTLYPINPKYIFEGEEPIFPVEKENVQVLEVEVNLSNPDEFGHATRSIMRMLSYIKASPILAHEVLGYFERYLHENEELIDSQIIKTEQKKQATTNAKLLK